MALTDQQQQILVLAIEELRDTYKGNRAKSSGSQAINDAAVVMAEGIINLIDIVSRLEEQPEYDWNKLELPTPKT